MRSMESKVQLYDHQIKALAKLKSGSVLCGGVGSGKTLTGLSFYLENYKERELYVITTAKKRNSGEWEEEAALLGITNLVVDSWNNIKNYAKVNGAFFIFDEQRVVGSGTWAKTFIKMAPRNKWIMLSATPGDNWMDYLPLFMANGFYRTKQSFIDMHVEYDPYVKFPRIKRYHNEGILIKHRQSILVMMPVKRHTLRHRTYRETDYDEELYKMAMKERWDPFDNKPIKNASKLLQVLRRITGTSDSRIHEAAWQIIHAKRLIIFYNYEYEREILVDLCEFLGVYAAEYTGNRHDPLPTTKEWIYIVQYTAGAEGWNCTTTDSILFYSPNYSYKITEQAEGRIDRINTKYIDLNYTILTSKAPIDQAVIRANIKKQKFNEQAWIRSVVKNGF